MKTSVLLLGLAACLFFGALCNQKISPEPIPAAPTDFPPLAATAAGKMNGLTYVAMPKPPTENTMLPIRDLGATWIAVVPYAFTRPGEAVLHYKTEGEAKHWWGETPEGIRQTIRAAHENGLKVMLKPQVWIPDNWTGTLDFQTPEDCTAWEAGYEKYILFMAQIADSLQVELFCVGTEFKTLVAKRPEFWFQLIEKTRATCPRTKLTFSSNWDDWEQMPFWDKLDFIGLGGYFPLVEDSVPPVPKLVAAWQPIRDRLEAIHLKHKKPILFTEYGYLPLAQCGWRNWEIESGMRQKPVHELAQANCYEALFTVLAKEDWWAGGFCWKWFPGVSDVAGRQHRDYSPQGKLGAKVLQRWFAGGPTKTPGN